MRQIVCNRTLETPPLVHHPDQEASHVDTPPQGAGHQVQIKGKVELRVIDSAEQGFRNSSLGFRV